MMNIEEIRSNREKTLRQRIAEDPRDITARLELAVWLSGEGRDDEAREQFEQANSIQPGHPDVISLYARFLLSRDLKDEAEKITAIALEDNPVEILLLKAHASALLAIGDFEEAIEELRVARGLVTDDPTIDYQLVESFIANGEVEEAEALARDNLAQFPDCPVRAHSLGRALWAQERYEEAREMLERSLEMMRSLNVMLDLCGVLSDMEKYDEAISYLEEKLDDYKYSAEFLYALANLYADSGQSEKAIKLYLEAVALNPRHFHALNNLALLLQEKDAPSEEVEGFFKRALDANPEDIYANLNYGNFLLVRGRREEAIPHYSKVISKEPWYYAARLSYAQTLLELGRRDEALQELKQVGHEELTTDEIASLGMLLVRANREEDGERLLQRAVKVSQGKSFTALEYLGDFLLERGRVHEAVKCYFRAILIDPSDTAIWLKAVGNLIDFRESFEVSAEIERFIQEGLPDLYEDAKEDELVSIFRVINEAIAAEDPQRLDSFADAAWQLKQPALLAVLGKLYGFFDEDEEARLAFEAAKEVAPRDLAIRREYIGWLISLDDFSEAKTEIEDAMKELPDEPMLLNDYGLVLFSLGDVQEAQRIFLKLSRENRLEATYVYNYAWMLYNTGMLDIAAEVLQGLLDGVGFDVESAFFLAQIIAEKRARSEFSHAMDLLRKVLAARENHYTAWTLLGWLQEETGDLRSAEYSISKALKIAPKDVNVLLSAAGYYTSVMKFKEARAYLAMAERLAPDSEDVLQEKARLLQAEGNYADSVLPLKRLFLLSPESYAFHLACTLHHLGEKEEASRIVAGLLSKPVTRTTSTARGWYFFVTGDIERAVSDTASGMKDHAEIVDFRNLAMFFLSARRYEEAKDSLRVFISYVTQPLDVFFFIRDLEDYSEMFPERQAREFQLKLMVKLRDMLQSINTAGSGIAKA
ncbi:MAG: hypothetical protein Kow00107_03360 [Planctomycetota bacterium]